MNILKSIGAVLAGFIFIVVASYVVDTVLETTGIFTPPTEGFHTTWMVITATIYRTIISIAGWVLAASLAPSRPMLHALILGFIGLAAGTAAAIVVIPMNLAPIWFPIILAAGAVPCAWVGGMLAERRTQNFS